MMPSISSIEKDSIATIQDSFKDCKLVAIFFKNDCSVRHTFYTIFFSLSVAKILEKHVPSSSYLVQIF